MNSVYAIILFQLLGSAAIIAEIMIPSMGLLSVAAAGSYFYSYYILYQISPEAIWVLGGVKVGEITQKREDYVMGYSEI